MSIFRRLLTLAFAALLFQGNVAAAAMCPMGHGASEGAVAADGADEHGPGHGGMQMPDEGAPSRDHDCTGTGSPLDCAAMSACTTPVIAAPAVRLVPAPMLVAPVAFAAAVSPASRSAAPDVPPPRA